ncbi:MAG: dehydrogenase [Acidobacteriaceae bacterium]|nr:dehydrogenase [Acidobacteriaceae bacterium]
MLRASDAGCGGRMTKTVKCVAGGSVLRVLLVPVLLAGATAFAQTCCGPTEADFSKVGGNLGNQSYSALSKITKANITQLGAAWHDTLEGGANGGGAEEFQQASVVAVSGVLFVETTQGNVFAVNGKTGAVQWKYAPGYGSQVHRGVAVGEGKVFATLADRRVVALDQKTGAVVWGKQLAEETTVGSFKTAVVYFDGLIYLGSADGTRGAAFALDAKTGAVVWKVYGIPAPGEAGNETWAEDSWKTGGASPWMHPAIDPELGLVYWAFGNARAGAPVDGSKREGQNLFADSLVALNAKTGKRVWYFQSVHHDIWDMDGVMAPLLFDVKVAGRMRKGVVYGSKTGMWYILDRADGTPLTPIVEKPVPQEPMQKTWPTQPFPVGDSLLPLCPAKSGPTQAPPGFKTGCIFTPHTDEPIVTSPGIGGGNDWNALSFDPRTKLIYTGVSVVDTAHSITDGGVGFRPLGTRRSGKVLAFNPATHRIAWQREMQWGLSNGHGILTTAGDVMFIGLPDGLFLALDIKDGRELWRFQTGAGVHTAPITYTVDGEQYVAVFAGGNALPYNSQRGDSLWAFKLGGTVAQAVAPPALPVRQPIYAAAVEGSVVKNTVSLARSWRNGAVVATESATINSMAPQHLRVPVGTTVTFLNPAGNAKAHCAVQFYEGLFSSGKLEPGQTFVYTFKTSGEYFYNDCTSPRSTGKVVVY